MEKETPEEKAIRLGVPLFTELPYDTETEEELAKEKQRHNEIAEQVVAHANKTVAVCAQCGKEISRWEKYKGLPCGDMECPFGILTNKSK